MKRYLHLYDDAAKEYANAVHCGVDSRTWKGRLKWLDKMLAKNGEIYLEKIEEVSC